jgi:hypothetical protein
VRRENPDLHHIRDADREKHWFETPERGYVEHGARDDSEERWEEHQRWGHEQDVHEDPHPALLSSSEFCPERTRSRRTWPGSWGRSLRGEADPALAGLTL